MDLTVDSHQTSCSNNYLCLVKDWMKSRFIVNSRSPLKAQEKLWNDELRLELVKLSISDYPRFQASDFEFHLPRPAWQYTLEKLREAFPDREFYFIISFDNWEHLDIEVSVKDICSKKIRSYLPRPAFPSRRCRGNKCNLIHSLYLKSVLLLFEKH